MMHSQRDRLCEHLQRVPYFAGLDAAVLCELAARLGTVPDVLSRALRILADGGLIRFDRRQITILDRPGLLQRAQLAP